MGLIKIKKYRLKSFEEIKKITDNHRLLRSAVVYDSLRKSLGDKWWENQSIFPGDYIVLNLWQVPKEWCDEN